GRNSAYPLGREPIVPGESDPMMPCRGSHRPSLVCERDRLPGGTEDAVGSPGVACATSYPDRLGKAKREMWVVFRLNRLQAPVIRPVIRALPVAKLCVSVIHVRCTRCVRLHRVMNLP